MIEIESLKNQFLNATNTHNSLKYSYNETQLNLENEVTIKS